MKLGYKFKFLKILNSPFVGLKLKWYFGEIRYGTPYFLPRKWVKCNMQDALVAWDKLSNNVKETYERGKGKQKWLQDYIKSYTKPVPIKYFGFDFTSLGWKPKWDEYRFEWNPLISIVLFGKQLFIEIIPNTKGGEELLATDCYWEAWLTYENKTDKSKSVSERLEELYRLYSCSWGNDENGYIDYYPYILKKKYYKN